MEVQQKLMEALGIVRSCVVALLVLLVSMPVSAAQSPATPAAPSEDRTSRAFEFYPADKSFGEYFDPTINAGSSKELVALLGNTGEISQELRVYAVNAFTAKGGGFAASDRGETPNDVTQWIKLPERIFTVEPGQGVEIRFKVSVPDSATPGQYIAALAGEHAEGEEIKGSGNFLQKLRYLVPIFITVPGDTTTSFDVGDIDLSSNDGGLVVEIDLSNTGDVRVRPQGDVQLVDADGAIVASAPIVMESIYAHDTTILTISFPTVENGTYGVRVHLRDPESGETASSEVSDLAVASSGTLTEQSPAGIFSSSVAPGPTEANVQFATVTATISNIGDPIQGAQLSLLVEQNGVDVERFPISQSLSVPSGETPITTRYIPLNGWSSGEWTFELLLETIDPATGAAVVVASQPIEGAITIP